MTLPGPDGVRNTLEPSLPQAPPPRRAPAARGTETVLSWMAFLAKPFTPSALLERVRAILDADPPVRSSV